MTNILIILGSATVNSHTLCLGRFIESELNKFDDINVELIDLCELNLPFANPKYHHNPEDYPNKEVQYLVKAVNNADSIILGSPNYHGSYSALLKNALDILNMDNFKNKPVGIISNSGGHRSTEPITQMRLVVRNLLGLAIPNQISTCRSDYSINNETGEVTLISNDIKMRVHNFIGDIVNISQMMNYRDLA